MSLNEDTSTRSWNGVADDWVAHADTNDYRNHYLMPRTLAMLGEVNGKAILDLGCGEGGYARALSRRGARVTGVDGSERLIDLARQRALAEALEIEFLNSNANALDALGPASFDAVLASMCLMDVEDYAGAIREVHRILRVRGELVMSITHPCFSAPVSSWVRSAEGELQHYAVDRYFERSAWDEKITPAFRAPVLHRHRPLEDYMGSPLECGFVLREFSEPSATETELTLSGRFRKLL
ncbi:MAG: class I SAM-dependent methyltransferase, partial [Acidobacteriota bacterium]|nr:class I SAM-dependent methyltransferase [Acidobacteriota bacterium]